MRADEDWRMRIYVVRGNLVEQYAITTSSQSDTLITDTEHVIDTCQVRSLDYIKYISSK